jgi:hypothetical protein
MASTSQTPVSVPSDDEYDSADDPDFALPTTRPKRSARPRTTRRPSGSGSAGSSSSSSVGSSSSDEDGGGRSPKRARRAALETRSGHVYGEEAGPSTRVPLSTADSEPDRPPVTLAQLQALDRERTRSMLAGSTGILDKGKAREEGAEMMMTVRVKHRFAGEDVWSVQFALRWPCFAPFTNDQFQARRVEKSVPASSKEARIWGEAEVLAAPAAANDNDDDSKLQLRPISHSHDAGPGGGQISTSGGPEGTSRGDLEVLRSLPSPRQQAQATPPLPTGGLDSSSAAATALEQPSPSSVPPPPPPPSTSATRLPPPKRRKGGGLAAASLAAKNKGKKMSTLEKVRRPPRCSALGACTDSWITPPPPPVRSLPWTGRVIGQRNLPRRSVISSPAIARPEAAASWRNRSSSVVSRSVAAAEQRPIHWSYLTPSAPFIIRPLVHVMHSIPSCAYSTVGRTRHAVTRGEAQG